MGRFYNSLLENIQPYHVPEFQRRFAVLHPALEILLKLKYNRLEYELFLSGNTAQYLIGCFDTFFSINWMSVNTTRSRKLSRLSIYLPTKNPLFKDVVEPATSMIYSLSDGYVFNQEMTIDAREVRVRINKYIDCLLRSCYIVPSNIFYTDPSMERPTITSLPRRVCLLRHGKKTNLPAMANQIYRVLE